MSHTNKSAPLISRRATSLHGTITVPGDKSISHRSIILGSISTGVTTVQGLLEGEDVLCTIAALKSMGAEITKSGEVWRISGVGRENLKEPSSVLDMGNSGTAARLLMGLLSTHPFTSFFTGDASLTKRPMTRVITPLEQMGAQFTARTGGKMPLAVVGTSNPEAIVYRLPVASAQVKSAILLAGLNVSGITTVIEKTPTRDHSERMMKQFGAKIEIEKTADGAESISITGKPTLVGQNIVVPSDISSAAFPLVAALIRPGSAITLRNVGVNPRRTGIITTLQEMGANIIITNQQSSCGEPIADIMVQSGQLKGVVVEADRAPSMIDEYPVLAMAAACANGTSRFKGLSELRVKESDRLALIADGLKSAGASVEIEGDDLIIHGNGTPPKGGAMVKTELDHRIAMSFLVLGSASTEPMQIDDGNTITTSFPGFAELMNGLGMNIKPFA